MAYWIQETGGNHNLSNYRMFYFDTESEIDDLPTATKEGKQQDDDSVSAQKCSYGSEAYCLETGSVYILSKDTDTWMGV